VGRRLLVCALLVLVLAASASASAPPTTSWADAQIRAVTAAGLMGARDPVRFRPSDPLTAQALENLAFALAQRQAPLAQPEPQPAPYPPSGDPTQTTSSTTPEPVPASPGQVPNANAPVTMTQLDARLVSALGLSPAAAEFARGAGAAGLNVPARFGTEVVARLLDLRFNHPASDDPLELLPDDPATRAEAAYSAAQILGFSGREVAEVQSLADSFSLPALTDWQRRILDTAVARIGMPYVWGGTSDGAETDFGVASRGGYDCSGFVWRVYKLEPYAGEGNLAAVLRGRTTYQMSGELPRSQRLGFTQLQPADVLFFGDRGPRSKPTQIGHAGIYLGNGWFIQASGSGVAVARLDGWYRRAFAWARRPLAEAGLG
jgi:cell wall-associated NlpC family hydrolase